MDPASPVTLIVPLVMSAVAALGILHVYASLIRNETTLHELRRRVKEIQYGRALTVAERKGMIRLDDEELGEVEILDDDDLDDDDDSDEPAGEVLDAIELQDDAPDADESLAASAA